MNTPSPVIELTTVEISRLIRIALDTTFKLKKKAYRVQTDSRSGRIEVTYLNGPTLPEMEALVSKYRRGFDRTGHTFTEDGDPRVYIAKHPLFICCTRRLTPDFLTRCAQLHCRRVHKPLPQIINDRLLTQDEQLKQEIISFIACTSETALVDLEQQAEALPPPPEVSQDEASYRKASIERHQMARLRSWEINRQQYLFCLQVYQRINESERISKLLSLLEQMNEQIRSLAPEYEDPAVCSFCCISDEKKAFQTIGNFYACLDCVQQGKAQFPFEDLEPLLPGDEQPYQFQRDENGLYYAKNGELAPILTRDLLQDIRFGIWWLAFERKPSEEVRTALHQAGWEWSRHRRQWFHPNKFGMVPPIIFEVYGGYLDAGFSVYRELRAERLRSYANHIEGKAEQAWNLSNETVQQYMSTGTLIVGSRQTRSLQKRKERAERLAQTAKELDSYAHDLRVQANRSAVHQEYVTRTALLRRVIKRLEAEERKEERDFHELVHSQETFSRSDK